MGSSPIRRAGVGGHLRRAEASHVLWHRRTGPGYEPIAGSVTDQRESALGLTKKLIRERLGKPAFKAVGGPLPVDDEQAVELR